MFFVLRPFGYAPLGFARDRQDELCLLKKSNSFIKTGRIEFGCGDVEKKTSNCDLDESPKIWYNGIIERKITIKG